MLTTANKIPFIITAITDGKHTINVQVKDTKGQAEFGKFEKGVKGSVSGIVDTDGNIIEYFIF